MKFKAVLLFILAGSVAFALDPAGPPIKWTAFPDPQFTVNGLPWFAENGGTLYRLREKGKESYPRSVRGASQIPSGARIRFRTDSTLVALRLEYKSPPGMRNMSPIGQSGVDLYVGDTYWANMSAFNDAKPGKIYEQIFFSYPDRPRQEREITFYLPLYEAVKVVSIGLDPEARVAPPQPFALPKPVVFYGTSITQGGCVSRPGMAFEAIVGRRLNIDFVNLGYSGAGLYEPIVAEQVAAIDAACFVLDGSNIKEAADNLKAFGPFVDILRARHPLTPIIMDSPPYSAEELTTPTRARQQAERRVVTRQFVSDRRAAGDRNIYLIEGLDLLNASQGAGLVDGAHLNDLGSEWFADGLTPRLAPVIGLKLNAP